MKTRLWTTGVRCVTVFTLHSTVQARSMSVLSRSHVRMSGLQINLLNVMKGKLLKDTATASDAQVDQLIIVMLLPKLNL